MLTAERKLLLLDVLKSEGKILASELMYALDKNEAEAEEYLDSLLSRSPSSDAVAGGR